MAMSVVYTTIDGVLVHEDRGGVERQYVGDPLGSLVGELDENQNLTYTAEYWPYGEVKTESGTKQSEWGYVGLLGYLKDLATLLYVRARHYMPHKARWLTVDPLWPSESPYAYGRENPNFHSDPTGLSPLIPIACLAAYVGASGCALGVWYACKDWEGAWSSFEECAWDYIKSLPWWSRAGCLIALGGCIACLARYARRLLNRGTCCCVARIQKEACCNTPRSCKVSDNCAVLRSKLAIVSCCHTARLAIGACCYKGVDDRHVPPIVNEGRAIANCMAIMARPEKRCAPFFGMN